MRNSLKIALLGLALFIGWATVRIVKDVQFNQNCQGYLKQSADAHDIPTAVERLGIAIDYMEANDLTDGYTSVLWRTEGENVKYWYDNLKGDYELLFSQPDSIDQNTQSNLLKRHRKTVLDVGSDGEIVTAPPGISVYPNNTAYAIWGWVSLLIFLSGGITFGVQKIRE